MTPEELEKRFGELEEEVTKLKADNETLTKRAEDAEAATKAAEDANAALQAKLEKQEDEEEEDEEMEKRADLPESVRKQMDDQAAEIKKQADLIQKMQEDNERAVFVSKAKDTYSNLPVSADELGEALRGISKAAPGSLEVVEKALAAGEKAIADALVEKGVGGEGDGNNAFDALTKAAEDIQKRDGITKEQAFVKAKNENPELWNQHRAEQRKAH